MGEHVFFREVPFVPNTYVGGWVSLGHLQMNEDDTFDLHWPIYGMILLVPLGEAQGQFTLPFYPMHELRPINHGTQFEFRGRPYYIIIHNFLTTNPSLMVDNPNVVAALDWNAPHVLERVYQFTEPELATIRAFREARVTFMTRFDPPLIHFRTLPLEIQNLETTRQALLQVQTMMNTESLNIQLAPLRQQYLAVLRTHEIADDVFRLPETQDPANYNRIQTYFLQEPNYQLIEGELNESYMLHNQNENVSVFVEELNEEFFNILVSNVQQNAAAVRRDYAQLMARDMTFHDFMNAMGFRIPLPDQPHGRRRDMRVRRADTTQTEGQADTAQTEGQADTTQTAGQADTTQTAGQADTTQAEGQADAEASKKVTETAAAEGSAGSRHKRFETSEEEEESSSKEEASSKSDESEANPDPTTPRKRKGKGAGEVSEEAPARPARRGAGPASGAPNQAAAAAAVRNTCRGCSK